jgi:hypothetical protein
MKYLVIVIAVVTLISAGSVAYLYLNPGYLVHSNEKTGGQLTSDQAKDLSSRLNKLQNDLTNLKDIFTRESLFIQQLKDDNILDKARIVNLEEKLQSLLSENKDDSSVSNPDTKTNPLESSLQSFPPELFNNPEFARLFHDQVNQVVKDIQKEERETLMNRFNEQEQQRTARRIDEFAKAQNLNDYQKQELNKIINERINKTMVESSIMSSALNSEEHRTKMDTIKNESNEKVKQILLPQQYDEYKKIENRLVGGDMIRISFDPTITPTPQTR